MNVTFVGVMDNGNIRQYKQSIVYKTEKVREMKDMENIDVDMNEKKKKQMVFETLSTFKWRANTGRNVSELHFTSNDGQIVISDTCGVFEIIDVENGARVHKWKMRSSELSLRNKCRFGINVERNAVAYCTNDGLIFVYDLDDRKIMRSLRNPMAKEKMNGKYSCVQFSTAEYQKQFCFLLYFYVFMSYV